MSVLLYSKCSARYPGAGRGSHEMSDVSTNYNILTIIKPSCFAFEKVMSRERERAIDSRDILCSVIYSNSMDKDSFTVQ